VIRVAVRLQVQEYAKQSKLQAPYHTADSYPFDQGIAVVGDGIQVYLKAGELFSAGVFVMSDGVRSIGHPSSVATYITKGPP